MFKTTAWTDVEAASGDSEVAMQALQRVMENYRDPLCVHIAWRFSLRPEDAEDLVHGFVKDRVLQARILAGASRVRGRFRNFLVKSLDNYVLKWLRSQKALKRRPKNGFVPIDTLSEEELGFVHPDDPVTEAWAAKLHQVVALRMESECRSGQNESRWLIFKEAVVDPELGLAVRPTNAEMATRYGFESAEKISRVLVTAKRMYGRLLREAVVEYEGEVEEELRDLNQSLKRRRGRTK